MKIRNPFGNTYTDLVVPDHVKTVAMNPPNRISDAKQVIAQALAHPIASRSFIEIAKEKLALRPSDAQAVILVSDNTRPVPYKGEEGILLPLVEALLDCGYAADHILVLIATGTHRDMTKSEIADMIDPKVFELGITIINHNCHDAKNLVSLGKTRRGTEIELNRFYVEADLKIATGLVESHFMAGASGGRKAVCPGIISEKGTYVFHSAVLMADPNARDLNLEGNPVHLESLEVAQTVGVDFLVNVTVDHEFHVTGVFAGDLVKAHEAAVEHLKKSVQVESSAADVVITHGGFVGINHYQCAKCGVASLGILKKNGYLIMIADTKDMANPVGSLNYRTTLALLKLVGGQAFLRLITSDDWTFIPEQWQVQQWAKVFDRIPQDHLLFYSPKMDAWWWPGLPGSDARQFLSLEDQKNPSSDCFTKVVSGALQAISEKEHRSIDELSIAWIQDGPYVVPVSKRL